MSMGEFTVRSASSPRSDHAFQDLLLKFSAAAAEGIDGDSLIQLFCRSAREFFQVDGVYFWKLISPDELIGVAADGWRAELFVGLRFSTSQASMGIEAIHARKTVCANHLDPSRSALTSPFQIRAAMASPLIVFNDVVGVAVFGHSSNPDFFTADMAAKATILAGQIGSLLEATRLAQAQREEHRRAEMLAEVAHSLHTVPDPKSVVESLADQLRNLLRTRLVCVVLRQGSGYELTAVSTESPHWQAVARAGHDRKGLQVASDLAARALAAGEPITVLVDPASHALGELGPAGVLIAAPFRTSLTQGAILIYPRAEGAFNDEEKSLVATVASFGAVAIANAELYASAHSHAQELHQLLDIVSELGSIGQLDEFMPQFAQRAAGFMGFDRALIALLENGQFHVRWGHGSPGAHSLEVVLSENSATQALIRREIYSWDGTSQTQDTGNSPANELKARQVLMVPVLSTFGEVLGTFGVLNRTDGENISSEDTRRAKILASQIGVALQVAKSLRLSKEQQQRAESLMAMALELSSLLRLPQFAQRFVARVAEITAAGAAALAIQQEPGLETVAMQHPGAAPLADGPLRRFNQVLAEAITKRPQAIFSASAGELFGPDMAATLNWSDCTLVRLQTTSGELLGVLCLANRPTPLSAEDEQLLHAIAGHASVALENVRLFTRMDGANRHWMEIFDAITDFIVVHDSSDNIMRINRSLADFIGVSPKELIGVNMCALLVEDGAAPLRSCPFCRNAGEEADEYVHPALGSTYLVSTSRVHGATNESLQTIHVLKDITDRREAERRYRELFGNIQEGLFFSTPEGGFIEVNDALVRMLGYSTREELLQVDVRTGVFASAEQYQRFAEPMQADGIVRNHEEALHRKDGSTVYVLINAFAVRDPQGRIAQYRGLMLDITDLKAFQAELQRERDFSGKILNNTQSLILVTDTAGIVSYANRRWQDMGYEQKQVLGASLESLVGSPRRQAFKEAFDAILGGRQVDNLDLQILRSDGRVGQFSVNLNPMRDEQGNVTSIVVVMSDITDAATLQAKLMHAEKMAAVGQLVSGVAHEVNNPLTAILGFADLLMENADVPEVARKDLRVILQEAQRTKLIVQNLLSFARQMPPQRKPVELNSILRRTVQLRSYDFQSHGVEVTEDLDQTLPLVIGDSHQLQQVFLNILNNAYDAVRETARPARIQITTHTQDKSVQVSFRDNGHGITSPDRIFDPFFTTKEVGKGTGLGLSICYGIVHEHGGEILCYNNAGAEGATFVVRLPAASESASIGAAAGVKQR
jgi:PAS domain S-box-containing protein